MARSFDQIYRQIEHHLTAGDFLGAARVLEQELETSGLSGDTRAECLYWLGVSYVTRASELVHKNPLQAGSLFENAERRFKDALALRPRSVHTRQALGRLLLNRHRLVGDVLNCLLPLQEADIQTSDLDKVFQIHSALMLLATVYFLALYHEEGMERYQTALSDYFRDLIKEPDLSSFIYFHTYDVAIPHNAKAEILRLVCRFRVVNPSALLDLQTLREGT